jgi:GC-rich sequence DNA-binding factor
LYEYSHLGDEEDESGSPDAALLASMISTAVIPKICKVVDGGALDVYSERHIRRMVNLAEEVEASIGKNDKFQVCSILPSGWTACLALKHRLS